MADFEENKTEAKVEGVESRPKSQEKSALEQLAEIGAKARAGTLEVSKDAKAKAAAKIGGGVEAVKGPPEAKAEIQQAVAPVEAKMDEVVAETGQRVEGVMAEVTGETTPATPEVPNKPAETGEAKAPENREAQEQLQKQLTELAQEIAQSMEEFAKRIPQLEGQADSLRGTIQRLKSATSKLKYISVSKGLEEFGIVSSDPKRILEVIPKLEDEAKRCEALRDELGQQREKFSDLQGRYARLESQAGTAGLPKDKFPDLHIAATFSYDASMPEKARLLQGSLTANLGDLALYIADLREAAAKKP